uniref:Uncharacterized protein n=1 Tax=Tanacetum cinerariifolium TaxID=118510 RepID=A0A6L2MFE2_TANCI|nr:hypothetical protein [Tanacetum cinerariifolium]
MVIDHVVNGKLNSPRICTFGIGDQTVVQIARHELLIHWVLERSSRHSKKNSMNEQKSGKKSSRGSKGKDKKNPGRFCGSSFL